MKPVFGILALLIGLAAGLPYIKSILQHKTRPHRVSWAIWAALGTITLSSYLAKGAHWSALLALAAAFNNFLIFLFSFKYGVGGTSTRDRLALGLGLSGILLWLITSEATYALVFAISADAIGTLLTLEKSYKDPRSENVIAWGMAALASVCGLLAVQHYTFAQTVYPVYAVIGGLSLVLMSAIRRLKILPVNQSA